MDVDLGWVNAGEDDVGQDHHAESLVDLPQVHLTRLEQRGHGSGDVRRLRGGGGGGCFAEFWILIVLFRPSKSEKIKEYAMVF
jgi:hypothetical protein